MKKVWKPLAIICVLAAGISLWFQHFDAAFVIATAGALAWFLSYRVIARNNIGEANADDDRENLTFDDEDDYKQ